MWETLGRMPGIVGLAISALTLFGTALGAFIGYYASRKVDTKTGKAQDQLIKTLDEIIRREREEKEDYRNRLHDVREKMQAVQLDMERLQSMPDLTKMFEAQQLEAARRYEVYTQQTTMLAEQSNVLGGLVTLQRELIEDFKRHEQSNGERQQAITSLLETLVSRSLNGQVKTKKLAQKLKQA